MEINRNTECCVCYETFDNYIQFNCHHFICDTCLIGMRDTRCPMCRIDLYIEFPDYIKRRRYTVDTVNTNDLVDTIDSFILEIDIVFLIVCIMFLLKLNYNDLVSRIILLQTLLMFETNLFSIMIISMFQYLTFKILFGILICKFIANYADYNRHMIVANVFDGLSILMLFSPLF